MNEFKVNEFLTLKLEGDAFNKKTNIYVNGELFEQCMYLMLNIPIEDTEKYDDIESIDEAADILGWTEERQLEVEYKIDPETEFWGHCSNLQAWYEHDYDTRLLHSNLSFPLLKKLTEAGDPVAKKVFKEEIAKRFESGYPTVIKCISKEGLLKYLNREERKQIIEHYPSACLKNINKLNNADKIDAFYDILELLQYEGFIKEDFPALLEIIDNLTEETKETPFMWLLEVAKKSGLIKEHILIFLEFIEKLPSSKNRAFTFLHDVSKNANLIEEHLPVFLKVITKLHGLNKSHAFLLLLGSVKNAGLMKKHSLVFFEFIEKYPTDFSFSLFFEVLRELKLVNEYFFLILKFINKIPDYEKYLEFSKLIKVSKDTGLIEERYPSLLEFINEISDHYKSFAFSEFFDSIKTTELLNWHYSDIETKFLALLDIIPELPDHKLLDNFFRLFHAINGTKLLNKNFARIETLFLHTLERINQLPDHDKPEPFSSLILTFKDTELIRKYYSDLLKTSVKVTLSIGKTFPDLIKAFDEVTVINNTSYRSYTPTRRTIKTESVSRNGLYSILKAIHNNLRPLKFKIDLHDQNIEDLVYLETIDCVPEEIVGINLSKNLITEISGLEKFKNLKILNLNNNQISQLNGLEKLENLEELDLDRNYITVVKGIKSLQNLHTLKLSYNQISCLNYEDLPTHLNSITYDNNPITEFKGFDTCSLCKRAFLKHQLKAVNEWIFPEVRTIAKKDLICEVCLELNDRYLKCVSCYKVFESHKLDEDYICYECKLYEDYDEEEEYE